MAASALSAAPFSKLTDHSLPDLLPTVVDMMGQGLLVHDGKVVLASNPQVARMLQLAPDMIAPGADMKEFVEFAIERGDYLHHPNPSVATIRKNVATNSGTSTKRSVPGGRLIRADCRTELGLSVLTYTDITEDDAREKLLQTTLSAIAQGILIHDAEKIVASNARLAGLLQLPPEMLATGASWTDMIRHRAARGDYGENGEQHLQRAIAAFRRGENFSSEQTAGETFLLNECRFVDGMMVVSFTDITESKRLERQLRVNEIRIRRLAERDGLTGLTNRRAFDAELEERLRLQADGSFGGRCVALLMIDLDRFKPINDFYGHSVGDALLVALSERFLNTVRGGDVAARLGGDEFAVIATVDDEADAMLLANRLREISAEPVTIDGISVEVDSSVGVAFSCEEKRHSDDLISAADLALYAAKDAGRGGVAQFQPSMAAAAQARLRLESDLRKAIERDELVMHYQVQRDLRSATDVGYEALMRWQHGERGLIPPNDFIPVAEETGLIVELGRWALDRAAQDFAGLDEHTRVSVNVSPAQFKKSDIVQDVRDALEGSGLEPFRLEVEITEQLLIEDTEATLETLNQLKALGVGLSLDDFGSGYSSLAYLTRFPFSKIKIDRCFIDRMLEDPRSSSLVSSILALASSLGMKVTAEGVETDAQLSALADGSCDEAQGFLLGKPVPFAEIGSRRDCG